MTTNSHVLCQQLLARLEMSSSHCRRCAAAEYSTASISFCTNSQGNETVVFIVTDMKSVLYIARRIR